MIFAEGRFPQVRTVRMRPFFLATTLIFLAPMALHADDWPQWLGPHRNGVSAEKGLLAAFPKAGPTIVWQRDIGEGFSGPIVSGDRLILFHRVENDATVECLNAGTGKPIWKFTYPTDYQDALSKGNGPRSTPLISGNKVVALGAEGMLVCLSLEDGKKIWARSLAKDYKTPLGYFGIGTSPVVEQNLVLVNVGGKQAGIVAFDLDTGNEVWKATSDPGSYSSPTLCTIDGKRLAVFFTRTGAVVLEPKIGKVLFEKRFRSRMDASVNAATPLVIGDLAFFTASYDVGALLLKLKKDGADEVWADEEIMASQYNTSVYHDGHIYGFNGRVDSRTPPSFRCFELKTKKVKWDKAEFGNGSMILADGKLIVLTEDGTLHLVQATPFAFRETASARILDSGPCRAQIALANGRLYARDQRKLVCVDLKK
jgi:outer membrane protein assembly factor BamB